MRIYDRKAHCSGCGACLQSCSRNAIVMKEDNCGFLYPEINENLCIHCGACRQACPFHKLEDLTQNQFVPAVYALRVKDEKLLDESSSGGAFSAIVRAVDPDVVYGASWKDDWNVYHVGIVRGDNIDALRKSKYVQSDTGITFREVKKHLIVGKKVLYSGTPCQIAGLRAYLKQSNPNLFTCDLICEGVQSNHFWKNYLTSMQHKYGSKVVDVQFRDKHKHGWERSDFVLQFENGQVYRQTSHTKDSAYMNSFIFQGGNRDSCYECPFASIPRQGDFTIGDLWGWRHIAPEWSDNKGSSVVICNTEKAANMVSKMRNFAEIKATTIEEASRENPNIKKCTQMPETREKYLEDMEHFSYDELERKWLRPRSRLRKFVSRVKYILRR